MIVVSNIMDPNMIVVGDMLSTSVTPKEVSRVLGIDPKRVRIMGGKMGLLFNEWRVPESQVEFLKDLYRR